LGTGASWKWYTGGCGQTFVSSGISIVFSPTVNSAYSVRAEGFCNTTSCVSILLTIKPPPIAPLIATSDRNNYCSSSGGNIVLTATGGSGDKVVWYRLSCGGTIVGTGNPKTIAAPTSSVRYWSRWETTGCTSSVCISVGVNVLVSPTLPYAINPSSYTVCNNASGNISLSGSGGNGTSFCWFTGSCGGTVIGTGRNIIIPNPTTSTTYWGRNQTVSCGNSGCRSVVISIVSLPPLQPDTISGNINPTAGNTEVYRTIKVPALIYTWTAPSGWTGTSVTNSITYIVGGGSGVISVVPSNGCGSGPARTIDVKTGFNITGHFTYDNTVNTTLDSVWVYLKMNGTVLDSVRTDTTGYYHFSKKPAGIYNISARTHKQNASINSTDAAIVKLHYAGTTLITSSIRLHSADVNMSFSINTADAVKITRRYVGSDTSFARGDWDFEKPTGGDTINVSVYLNDSVIVGGGNVVQDFKGLCVGDVNGSNVPYPGAKCEPKVFLSTEGIKQIFLNKLLEIPLKVNSNISIGAISLIFNFPSKQISIADVRFALNDLNHGENEENFIYNIIGNELRIAWFENDGPIRFRAGDILFKIILKANSSINDGDTLRFKIKNSPDCEFADENANSIERVDLSIYSLVYSKKLPENAKPYNLDLNNFEVYPNPSSGCFTIKFFGEHQNASIKIYNTLGELIIEYDSSTIKNLSQIETSIFPDGIYFLKFVNESLTVTRKIVVARD